jgi:AcrR family transcriptional regulator
LLEATSSFATSFDDVRMDEISRASGVPRATLYYYFSSKEDLLGFLLRHTLAGMASAVREAVSGDASAPVKLGLVVHAQLEYLGSNPGPAQLLVANLGKAAKLPDLLAGVESAFHEPVETVLRDGVADGSLPAIDPELGATALFGAVTMVGLRYVVAAGSVPVEDITRRLLEMFFYGLSTPAAAGRSRRRSPKVRNRTNR